MSGKKFHAQRARPQNLGPGRYPGFSSRWPWHSAWCQVWFPDTTVQGPDCGAWVWRVSSLSVPSIHVYFSIRSWFQQSFHSTSSNSALTELLLRAGPLLNKRRVISSQTCWARWRGSDQMRPSTFGARGVSSPRALPPSPRTTTEPDLSRVLKLLPAWRPVQPQPLEGEHPRANRLAQAYQVPVFGSSCCCNK